jgi:type II secretory pathway component PulM
MSSQISPKLSRLLALTILVVLVLGSVNLVALPLLERFDTAQSRLADAAAWRARLSASLDRIPQLEGTLQETQEAAGSRKGILHVENEALGSAELQKMVQKLISDAGIQSRSLQLMPARREHDAMQLGIRISASGDEPAMVNLLESIQKHEPSLAVSNLNVSASAYRGEVASGPTAVDMQVVLEVLAVANSK